MSFNIDDIKSLKDLGEYLMNERKRAGITIEQIQKQTKIRIKYLVAIENGDFTAIPGGSVYVKGFLKNYVDVIGLDSNIIIELYKKNWKETEKEKSPDISSKQETTELHNIVVEPRIVGITILIVMFFVLSIVSIRSFRNRNFSEEITPPIAQQEPVDIIKEPALEESPEEETEIMVEIVEDTNRKTIYVIDDEYIEVTLEVADARCWISVNKGGSVDYEGNLTAGELKTWRAEKDI
ncbi:MAG: helix-turn-helix domain-containing protein, partial [Tepidanaerobacteraceae bacterium]|nr:helix-turn-helix domain-containing protein [Tepidanaerobacteraceae bacterium]